MTSAQLNLDKLIQYLLEQRSFDARKINQDQLQAVLDQRLQATGAEQYEEYVNYLEARPDEVSKLLDCLLETRPLLMDEDRWNYLTGVVLPHIGANKEEPLRIWIIESHDGREHYALALALYELLGFALFQHRAKIFVTSTNEDLLSRARQGLFS